MTPKFTPIGTGTWSTRAANALKFAGIESFEQLINAHGPSLKSTRNVGADTMREFARGCILRGVVPEWLKHTSLHIEARALPGQGFVKLAGPYDDRSERWMLECAIAQLGPIPSQIVQEDGGYVLYRSVSGYRETTEEPI